MIYFGPASDALAMFTKAGLPCPATRSASDHYLHVINEDFVSGCSSPRSLGVFRIGCVRMFGKAVLLDVGWGRPALCCLKLRACSCCLQNVKRVLLFQVAKTS